MVRLILYFLLPVVAIGAALSWLADRPGNVLVTWQGSQYEITLFVAVVALAAMLATAIIAWSLLRGLISSPATVGTYFNRRRQKKGLDALSSGMIALGAGDRATATRYALQARKTLPNEPMTHLLRAQAAQLSGDKATSRRIYEGMLNSPDTEQLGLRGLYIEADREGETEAARQFAERALKSNAKLDWAADALFAIQTRTRDWDGALATVETSKRNGIIEKSTASRRRAVLLTAKAQHLEDNHQDHALKYAIEAHALAPNLIPAAAIAGRIYAAKGDTPKATKVLQQTWKKAPHPDLATAYAFARVGDSPKDRLDRVKKLVTASASFSNEGPVAIANAAIDARDFDAARQALEPLLDDRATRRIFALMARIEAEEHGDTGRVRELLARAVSAPRDPAWVADGDVSDSWQAVAPSTNAFDACEWKVPSEAPTDGSGDLLTQKLEELAALSGPAANTLELRSDDDLHSAPSGRGDTIDAAPATSMRRADGPPPSTAANKDVVRAVKSASEDRAVLLEVTQPMSQKVGKGQSAFSRGNPPANVIEKTARQKQIKSAPTEPVITRASPSTTASAAMGSVAAGMARASSSGSTTTTTRKSKKSSAFSRGNPTRDEIEREAAKKAEHLRADAQARRDAQTAIAAKPVTVHAKPKAAESGYVSSGSTKLVPSPKRDVATAATVAPDLSRRVADALRDETAKPGTDDEPVTGAKSEPLKPSNGRDDAAQKGASIFISPRAPDDPGTERPTDGSVRSPETSYRSR